VGEAWTQARQLGGWCQLRIVLFAVFAASVTLFAVIVDVVLALIGGMLIGVFLGYWLIPWAVDRAARMEVVAARRRRRGR
jgi:hypothetical protein